MYCSCLQKVGSISTLRQYHDISVQMCGNMQHYAHAHIVCMPLKLCGRAFTTHFFLQVLNKFHRRIFTFSTRDVHSFDCNLSTILNWMEHKAKKETKNKRVQMNFRLDFHINRNWSVPCTHRLSNEITYTKRNCDFDSVSVHFVNQYVWFSAFLCNYAVGVFLNF